MPSISFKIPEDDKQFLEWYSKRSATPVGTLYRSVTQKEFQKWKLQLLVSLYSDADIGFIEMCNLGNISLMKGMIILEEASAEPPISDIIDDYTIELTQRNILDESGERSSIFKNGEGIRRISN